MATGTGPALAPGASVRGRGDVDDGAGRSLALASGRSKQVELPAVTVTATEVNESPTGPVQGFVARRAVTATKTDTAADGNAAVVAVITRDRMELQGAQSVQQAVGYTAGVTAPPPSAWTTAAIRSDPWRRFHEYLDGLLNSVGFYNNTRPDPMRWAHRGAEGPSGMLYGQGAVGGILNQVSKRPQAEAAREIGISYGNYQRSRSGRPDRPDR